MYGAEMSKLIINYEDVNIEEAISHVEVVIRKGKISKNYTQYCYATIFKNNLVVYADITKTGSYKFRVYQR